MAQAKRNIVKEQVERIVIEEKRVDKGIILELDHEEAQFLADAFALIGGSPTTTRRKHQQTISNALMYASVYAQYPVPDIDGHLTVR